jgi:hypothetical protein
MTIEQTVEIQADHRLVMELPLEIPVGKVKVELTVTPAAPRRLSHREAIEKCRGIAKGVLSSDEFLEMRRKDKELEDAQYRKMFHIDEGKD